MGCNSVADIMGQSWFV